MIVPFSKMHGAGNDFILIDDLDDKLNLRPSDIQQLCDRHRGIGADGVILVKPSTIPACIAFMDYRNSDGTLAQMCGNGIRCFAKFLVDKDIAPSDAHSFAVETRAGEKSVQFSRDAQGLLLEATVDMGEPILEPSLIPTTLPANAHVPEGSYVKDAPVPINVDDETPLLFTCVSMGNPHAVTFVNSMDAINLEYHGPLVESHVFFPEKTNVEFAHIDDDGSTDGCGRISMRVFERGCGETLACGTGCCATLVAAALTGRSSRKARLVVLGGELTIEWSPRNHVLMTGPATMVYDGTIDMNESNLLKTQQLLQAE